MTTTLLEEVFFKTSRATGTLGLGGWLYAKSTPTSIGWEQKIA